MTTVDEVEVEVGQPVDAGRHVVEGRGGAAAAPGQPVPTRRYSRFHAAQPLLGQVGGQRAAEGEVVRRLPEAAVDHHDDPARACPSGRESSPNWLGSSP